MNKKTKQKLLNIVKNNYEEIAEEFSSTRNYVWPELKSVIDQTTNRWSDQLIKILDLGCGNGRLFELFKNTNAKYTGIEQSHNLIKLAQKKYPKAKFIQGDVLKYNSNIKYDLILLIAVLQHIPSHELRLQTLKQIKNILKPNSTIIISNWNLHKNKKYHKLILKNNLKKILGFNSMDFNDIIFTGFNKKSQRYYHAFTKNELKKLLTQAGFNTIKIYDDKKNIYAICN